MGRGPCSAGPTGQAIGRSLRSFRSGKGRCAVLVLRDPYPWVPGFRRGGHEADERMVRERSRCVFKHRGGCGAEETPLAVVRIRGVRFQSMTVMRRTGEQEGEYQDGGERKQFHTGLITRLMALFRMVRLYGVLLSNFSYIILCYFSRFVK